MTLQSLDDTCSEEPYFSAAVMRGKASYAKMHGHDASIVLIEPRSDSCEFSVVAYEG